MLLVITAFALVASVPLAGGRLSRLADIRLRAVWTVFVSVVIQVGITTVAPGGSHALHVALHLISYVLAAWFLVANRHVTGILVVALGAGLNVLAISANGGVMPASANAMRIAGLQPGPRLPQLGARRPPASRVPRRRDPGARDRGRSATSSASET